MIRASNEYLLPSGRSIKPLGRIEGSNTDWLCKYTDREGGEVTLTTIFLEVYAQRV